jgi:hypothetical protein
MNWFIAWSRSPYDAPVWAGDELPTQVGLRPEHAEEADLYAPGFIDPTNATILSVEINGKQVSREALCAVWGEPAIEASEQWMRSILGEITSQAMDDRAAQEADYRSDLRAAE